MSSGHEGGRSSTSCILWTAGLLHFSSVHQSPGVTIPLTQIQSKYTSNKANSTTKHHYCLHLTKLRSNLIVKNTLQAKLDMLTLEVINSCTREPQWSWASGFSGCKALRHTLRTTMWRQLVNPYVLAAVQATATTYAMFHNSNYYLKIMKESPGTYHTWAR